MIRSALTELLGIEHPILSAPMAGVAGAALASAVTRAGAFGLLGGGYGDRGWLEEQLREVDCSSIGVGFITWRLEQQSDLLEVVLDHSPKAIFLSFGDTRTFARRITASGSLFIAQVQSLRDARAAADLGADIIVAQGTEAGGHGGARATLPLVPAVVDAVAPVPVVAAGGIADGRGLAAALMLGATGAVMGTRFYCSQESLAPAAAKSCALRAGGDDTTQSSVFDILRGYDWPGPYKLRTLGNRMTDSFQHNLDALRADKPAQIARFEEALAAGNYDLAPVIVGEVLDLVDDAPSATDIVQQTVVEAAAVLRRAANFELSD
jgi:nitronate monooxygenase